MSLRNCLPLLVLFACPLVAPANAQERAPSGERERRIQELRPSARDRIRPRRERFEFRRELRQLLRQHRQELRESLAERLARLRDERGERLDTWRDRRGERRHGRGERREHWRERLRSRRSR